MIVGKAIQLPSVALPQADWYRCVPAQFAHTPPRASTGRTRFNPGHLRILYFAPNPRLALFEARALLGSYFHASVPSPGQPYVVVQYQIHIGQQACIVDAREYELPVIDTTIQEMTGDWFTYPRNFPTTAIHAPTQNLADAIHRRRDEPVGLMAPSARNPFADNLILFEDRLPADSVAFHSVVEPDQI